jgi:Ca2+-binding EF-hand superfamily protein
VPKDKVDLTFRAFNSQKGKNGQITKDKFLEVMTKEGAAEREFAEAIFESFDKDSSGYVLSLEIHSSAHFKKERRVSY